VAKSSKAIAFDICPDETLGQQGGTKAASRIRFIAHVRSQRVGAYKEQNAWLLPEVDKQGIHSYLARKWKFPRYN
jgi:hypothetical protein